MAEQIYRYKAFISYRHVDPDRRWAKWLIDNLETYRTPRSLLAHGVPSHIGHLFRDDEEIPASSNLSNQIEEALKASQYLIVVCSPNTPKSQWCRHEIAYFRQLGKGDRILALLVEGEPDEAFPPELLRVPYEVTHADGSKTTEIRDEEPIASDVRPRADESRHVTERRALIRIAATLLGVSFDDLAQRDHQRAVRQQRIIGGAIAAAVLLVAGIGGWYWDYTRIKTGYFTDIGTRYAEPFGIGGISQDDASHRWVSYEVQSQRGHVVHVRRLNGSGGLRALKGDEVDSDAWNGGTAEWRVHYQGDHVGTIELFGDTGRLTRTETYRFFSDGQSGLVTFSEASGSATALESKVNAFRTRLGESTGQRVAQVTQHRLTFTLEGYVARRMFETVWGTAARDENGISGRAYLYNDAGQPVSIRNLDPAGATLLSEKGIAEEERAYNPDGSLSAFRLLDHNHAVFSNQTLRYDDAGNAVEQSWTGAEGKPILNDAADIARELDTFDARGNIVLARFLDETLQPGNDKNGAGQLAFEYDDKGRTTRTTYLDIFGKPVVTTLGAAGAILRWDANGNRIALSTFGPLGQPWRNKDGWVAQTNVYDANGVLVEARWFGLDGKLADKKTDGIAILRGAADTRGNELEERYYDAHDRPMLGSSGYWRARNSYDERGQQVRNDYFGTDNKPILDSTGTAGRRTSFNEAGYWTQVDYVGTDGNPRLNNAGYARVTYAYDDRGNTTDETFYGVSGERIAGVNGYSRIEQRFDGFDNLIEERCLGIDDKPVMNVSGYTMMRARYDARGNVTEQAYYDVNGKPVNVASGFARKVAKFDSADREVETRLYDANGHLTIAAVGFAVLRETFDSHGRALDFAMYDAADRPMVLPRLGFAIQRSRYDRLGNTLEMSNYGADGKPIVIPSGYATVRYTYDAHEHDTGVDYLGADGKPRLMPGGFASLRSRYDADGNLLEIASLGVDGKPIMRSDGYAIARERYNARGFVIEEGYFGPDGKPSLFKGRVSRTTYGYTSDGVLNRITFVGPNGKPVRL